MEAIVGTQKALLMITRKIRKLLSLSLGEILFRSKAWMFVKYEHLLNSLGLDAPSDKKWVNKFLQSVHEGNTETDVGDIFLHGPRNLFFTEVYDKELRLKLLGEHFDLKIWLAEADKVMGGVVELLGHLITLPVQKGWHIDPLSSVIWPQRFYAQVSKNSIIKDCDIKYIWEVNRHQYLIPLGMAYYLTGEKKYADRIVATIMGWIAENPYNTGVNWTSSLELAVRAISWIWAIFLCKDSSCFTPQVMQSIIRSLFDHGKYIEKHLSIYSSPYNHLIGEAAALHMIGSLFPMFKNGKRWENKGWGILSSGVGKQFHTDGLCVEQATFYHHFTLGFYLQAMMLRKINNKIVSQKVLKGIEKAIEFSIYITKPGGTPPMIGDIDNARSLYFGLAHSWDFSGFIAIGALLFNRSDFKFFCKNLPPEVLWLCDKEQIEKFLTMPYSPPQETSKAFYESGYYISRDSWAKKSNYLSFDCGEVADGLFDTKIPSAAHGHADALSFELVVHGKSFLVDGGFFTYFGELEWHKYFRQEEAHNTVKIQNHRQAKYCGRLTWQRVKKPELLIWATTKTYDTVAGRIVYSPDVYHERKIFYLKSKFWLICDFVSSKNNSVKTYLHFDPDVTLSIDENDNSLTATNSDVSVFIKVFQKCQIHADKGGGNPSEGWVGLGYGIKKPGWRVRFKWDNVQGDLILFPMLIVPRKATDCSIEEEESKILDWPQKPFQSSFKIDKTQYSLIIDPEKNITIKSENNKVVLFSTED